MLGLRFNRLKFINYALKSNIIRYISNAAEKAESSSAFVAEAGDIDHTSGDKSDISKMTRGGVSDIKTSMSFDDIPGPPLLKTLSKLWTFIPVFSNQVTASTLQYMLSAGKIFGSQLSWSNNLWLFRFLLDEYGPVVRLHGPFGGDVVLLSRPEHVNVIFQNEGPFPIRSSLDSVEKYRLQHRKYKHAGPFVMHGEHWQVVRKAIEQPMKKYITRQFDKLDDVCDEFVNRILQIRNRQLEVPGNFSEEVYKLTMESLCLMLLDQKFEYFCPGGLAPVSEAQRFLQSLIGATDAIRRCESGLHMWKFFETPSWKQLVKHCDSIDGILSPYIRKFQDKLRARDSDNNNFDDMSLVECLLLKEGMTPEDVLTALLDMLLIGVNMTAHAIIHFIYHISKNPRAQYKLHDEIRSAPRKISKEELSNLTYLKSCLKESLRLRPPMPVLSRVLTKDISVYGYKIPKGTYILLATHLSSLREEHFEYATKFKPERWIDSNTNKDMEILASIPFGHGPKACFAKELAETQINLLIYKILRRFRVEYHYGDISSTNRLLSIPKRALKFRFVDHY